MSACTIVMLGLGILLMVLLGTLTIGLTPTFYAGLTAFSAVLVAVIMFVGRGRSPRRY